MSLTASQKRLVKQAQRDAGLADAEYRDLVQSVAQLPNCRSSTDARLGNEWFDRWMSLAEAIYWRGRDNGCVVKPSRVFVRRGYWAEKNNRTETSRDRFAARGLFAEICAAENALRAHGRDGAYLAGIKRKTGEGWAYLAALRRTIKYEHVAG